MIRIFIFTNSLHYIFTFLLAILNSVSPLIYAKLYTMPVSLSMLAFSFLPDHVALLAQEANFYFKFYSLVTKFRLPAEYPIQNKAMEKLGCSGRSVDITMGWLFKEENMAKLKLWSRLCPPSSSFVFILPFPVRSVGENCREKPECVLIVVNTLKGAFLIPSLQSPELFPLGWFITYRASETYTCLNSSPALLNHIMQDLGSEHLYLFRKRHRGCLHPYLIKNHCLE